MSEVVIKCKVASQLLTNRLLSAIFIAGLVSKSQHRKPSADNSFRAEYQHPRRHLGCYIFLC